MSQPEVVEAISKRYITDVKSLPVKLLMNNGNIQKGVFIKKKQIDFNSKRNKWIITTDYIEIIGRWKRNQVVLPF